MNYARGIVATGVYLPQSRLNGDEIEAAWGTSAPVSQIAVPAADEDALTMAIAAARNALDDSKIDPRDINHLAIGTTTPPLEEEEFAPRAASALGLNTDCELEAATQSTVAGANVLLSAAAASGPALAVVSDAPKGDPAEVGQRVGAGAAAFLFDEGGAVILADSATRSRDAPGLRFRERGSETVEELDITTYERETIRDLVSTAAEALDIDHEAVDGASLYQPTPDIPHRIARALPYDAETVERGTLVNDVGDAGAATTAIGLLAALDESDPSSVTVAGFFGSGATAVALAFETRTAIDASVSEAIDGGVSIPYAAALRERGQIGETEVAGGGAHVSLPSWQRTIQQRYRLEAGQCPNCEAVAFPPEGACPDCHKRVEFDKIELPRSGEIVAVTVIGQGGAPPEFVELQRRDGPFAVAIVEVTAGDGTARFPVQLTDCEPDEVSVGDRVVGRVRRIYSVEGVTRYGLKFVPE
ncbi:3-hydroxy-3-methylglutaryl CoA synthase [Halomicroarcula sp. F13]|uniref:3-hydroxy-3-methylglutaryl CoA synthase n=1 Tax=Haloarcula rubra TaxID=2487747 RepID=A0AAW4PUG1_9EURY|nr:zinc ribbon domain-containing protein [Halomicroarcula rubra]MBX0325313.1 3-hydroxy-3-methylglutaryl CoA synthase [Halomicroarcula rubra]